LISFIWCPRPPTPVLFPYTTLFRSLIENALSDAVRFFHVDALSSAVGMKVDFDMGLTVLASGLYRLLARRMRGYSDAQARRIFRDRKSTRLNSSHRTISYAVFCLKK